MSLRAVEINQLCKEKGHTNKNYNSRNAIASVPVKTGITSVIPQHPQRNSRYLTKVTKVNYEKLTH